MMDATKSDGTSADDAKIKSDLFNLVENLRIELQKKDQKLLEKDDELAKEKQEKQELSADLDKEKARANRADKLETKLISAKRTIKALQLNLWQSFPSDDCNYYIKVKVPSENAEYRYLYVDSSGQLAMCFTWPYTTQPSQFKFTKNSKGTFSIYSVNKEKFLQTQTSSKLSRVLFSAKVEDSAGEFVFFFHPQNKQPGISVDISTLAGTFLYMDSLDFVVANSRTPPANKFSIIPVDM